MAGMSLMAVFAGAGFGAVLRWALSSWLNPLLPSVPLGTLAANLVGGLLVGFAAAFFSHHGALAPEWRLLIITGFLGGLTTFSTFSLEVVTLLARQQHAAALGTASLHLVGSLALSVTGIAIANALFAKA